MIRFKMSWNLYFRNSQEYKKMDAGPGGAKDLRNGKNSSFKILLTITSLTVFIYFIF